MKILKRAINDKSLEGTITLRAEDPEDMWHVYNLIQRFDLVKTTTIRKVVKEGNTGSTSSQRVRLTLCLRVKETQFDSVLCVLRVSGTNSEENQFVKMGQHHTIDLELNRDFSIEKSNWDSIAMERIENCCSIEKQADVAAVVMQQGLAHVCLIKGHLTVIKSKVEQSIPKKRTGTNAHGKGMVKFYENVMMAVMRHVDFGIVKCCLLASPGYVKDDFFKYMMEQAVKRDFKVILENKSKFLQTHASSGHKHALDEVLLNPKVQTQLVDTKAAADVKCIQDFFELMHVDQDRAYYGYNHVVKANEQLAVEVLLITDALFRSNDIQVRKKYVQLVEAVKQSGGQVRIFSSMHVSGEQLGQISGVAAMLRFPLPDIEDSDEASEDLEMTSDVEELSIDDTNDL